MEVHVYTCLMLVVLMEGQGSPVYWDTMQADTWLKKSEL